MNQVNLQTEEYGTNSNNALFPKIQKSKKTEEEEDNYGLSNI